MESIPLINWVLFPAPSTPSYDHTHPGLLTLATGEVLMRVCGRRTPHVLVLWSHGNAQDVGDMYPLLQQLAGTLGVDAVAYEYPGYGLAGGRANRWSIGTAAANVLDWAKSQYDEIILVGHSLGTGPASYQAELDGRDKVRGLCLISAYLSVDEIVADFGGGGWLPWLVSHAAPTFFDNRRAVAALHLPIFLAHGTADALIRPRHSLELAELFQHELSRHVEYKGRGHADTFNAQWTRDFVTFVGECRTAS